MADAAFSEGELHAPPRQLHVLYEDAQLRITEAGSLAAGNDAVIAFTGIGQQMGMQIEEFVRSASAGGRSAIFVTDKTRGWYNHPGLYECIVDQVAPRLAGARRKITIGNSMGAFGALLFAAPLHAQAAFAFAPRVSSSPRIIPEDRRSMRVRAAIAEHRFEDINDFLADGIRYYVVHGTVGPDALHSRAFRAREGLHRFVFPGETHALARKVRDAGLLTALFDAAIEGDDGRIAGLLASVGGTQLA